MIFKDIKELVAFAGGTINTSVSIASLGPSYHMARSQQLEQYLGVEYLDAVEADYDALAANAAVPEYIQKVQRAAALLMVYHYSFVAAVEFSGKGIVRVDSEDVTTAYKYQVTEHRRYTLTAGLNALEGCLLWLDRQVYTDQQWLAAWQNGEGAEYHRAVLLRFTHDVRRHHNQVLDRRAFEAMRPLQADVQTFVAESLLGEEQLNALLLHRTTAVADATQAEANDELLRRLGRAVAAFTVYEAKRRNVVQVDGGRLIQTEALEPQSMLKEGNAAMNMLNVSALQDKEFAERHLSYVRDFLNKNLEHFPRYIEWLASTQPDPEEEYPALSQKRPSGRVIRL